MNILFVEDDIPLGQSLRRVLANAGHVVLWLRTLADARSRLAIDAFDIVLLDIVLPDGTGLQLLREIREQGNATAVLVLTARDAVSDRVAGLDGGADDYLAKPFAIEELLSRLRVLQRRGRSQLSAAWRIGDIDIDTARRRVSVASEDVALSPREYDILVALAADPGKVMTRTQIERALSLVSGLESNALDVHIYNLRRKLGSGRISTVRGVGYCIACE